MQERHHKETVMARRIALNVDRNVIYMAVYEKVSGGSCFTDKGLGSVVSHRRVAVRSYVFDALKAKLLQQRV